MGLALKKIVINYAMAPFVIARAWEQHKISSVMNLPMINLVPGVGYGYANAGPTHYSNEDLGLANLIVNSNIYTVSDANLAAKLSINLLKKQISFVRLDEKHVKILNSNNIILIDINNGYRVIHDHPKNLCIISWEYLLNKINKIITEDKNFYNKITLIDLFQSKPINKNLSKILKNFFYTLVVDEQYENFNLSTLMLKYVNLQHLNNNIIPVSIKEYIDY